MSEAVSKEDGEYVEYKNKKHKIITKNEKTIVVEGIGKATDVGDFNIEGFIKYAMKLPSFWN